MATTNIDTDPFLDALYSAAVGATGWRSVIASYIALLDAPRGTLNIHDFARGASVHSEWLNLPDDHVRRSQEYWIAQEPWMTAGRAMIAQDASLRRRGFVCHGDSMVPSAKMIESPWYRDFGREEELQDVLAVTAFVHEETAICLSSNTGGRTLRTFAREKVELAGRLVDDVRRAFKLHVQMAREQAAGGALVHWRSTELPVLIVKSGRLESCNAAAERIFGAAGIIGAGHKFSIFDATLDVVLKAHEHDTGSRHRSLVAFGRGGSRWLAQLVRFNRLSGSLLASIGADDPAVLLTLTPLDQDAAGRTKALATLARLTATEREIAYHILNGESVRAIARERRLSVHTVRWYVRNLIEKTNARNLADLQRILALLSPL
jgi:DNA-binding CsgD family transcriptional regulator